MSAMPAGADSRPREPVVTVRAEANIEAEPEIARFEVTVVATDPARADMLARLTARLDEVRAVLDGYAPAIEKRETSGLSVWSESKGTRKIGFRGQVTTTVTVHDLSVVGEMVLRAADVEQTELNGPHWLLRPGSPVHRELRRAAVAEVIGRAREYAEALGARITGLVELSDSGISTMALGMAIPAAGAGLDLGLEPQRQQVSVHLEGRFTISPPAVLDDPVD
jgi:uncharacterized protein YggE